MEFASAQSPQLAAARGAGRPGPPARRRRRLRLPAGRQRRAVSPTTRPTPNHTTQHTNTSTQQKNKPKHNQVIKAAEALVKSPAAAEAELEPLERLVSEAYKELDTAVSKGVLHANTVARRKSRIAKYKRQAAIAAGVYTPAADAPGYSFYARLQATKAKA